MREKIYTYDDKSRCLLEPQEYNVNKLSGLLFFESCSVGNSLNYLIYVFTVFLVWFPKKSDERDQPA